MIQLNLSEQSSQVSIPSESLFANFFCGNGYAEDEPEMKILSHLTNSSLENEIITSADYLWYASSREVVFSKKNFLSNISRLEFTRNCWNGLFQFECHILIQRHTSKKKNDDIPLTLAPISHIGGDRKQPPNHIFIIGFVFLFSIVFFFSIICIAIFVFICVLIFIGLILCLSCCCMAGSTLYDLNLDSANSPF